MYKQAREVLTSTAIKLQYTTPQRVWRGKASRFLSLHGEILLNSYNILKFSSQMWVNSSRFFKKVFKIDPVASTRLEQQRADYWKKKRLLECLSIIYHRLYTRAPALSHGNYCTYKLIVITTDQSSMKPCAPYNVFKISLLTFREFSYRATAWAMSARFMYSHLLRGLVQL